MVLPFLALYLTTERGFTASRAGLLLSLYGVGAAAGTLGGGWLCDRVLFQVWGTYALTLRELYRLTEDRIGLLFAINTLIIVAVEMALVTALARRDPLRVAAAGALLLCLGLGLTPLGTSFAFAAFAVVVWTLGEMLAIPLTEGIVANRAGAGASGRYMGVFAATFSLAFVAAPALGTAVYSRFGPAAVWAGAAVIGPLLAAGYLALAPRFRAPRRRPTRCRAPRRQPPPERPTRCRAPRRQPRERL